MTNLAMLAICAMLFLVTLRLLHLTLKNDDDDDALSTLFIGGMATGLGMMTLTTTITKFIVLAIIFHLSFN